MKRRKRREGKGRTGKGREGERREEEEKEEETKPSQDATRSDEGESLIRLLKGFKLLIFTYCSSKEN